MEMELQKYNQMTMLKSSSFAKVLSTTVIETYEDGSYLVPCSLMC
jgi:hypothetical protein